VSRRRLAFRPGARAELRETRRYYEGQLPGLGRRFLADVDAALGYAVEQPEMFPVVEGSGGARRVLLRRFPYSLVYDVGPDVIVVLACVHHRQHPAAWQAPRR
jgi:plasmid stabilization system protein ParE